MISLLLHHLILNARELLAEASIINANLNLDVVCALQVKTKLKGHQNRITGLAFSQSLNILVSSGADAQVSE